MPNVLLVPNVDNRSVDSVARMSVRRIGANHTLPPNPEWVDFPRTDGDRNTWPTNTTPVVTAGEVNYFRPVGLDESLSINWRKSVGIKVAAALGLPCE